MLGRPNCIVPVFIKSCPGAWLKASVTIDFTTVMSSTCFARFGNNSESSIPDFPVFVEFELGAHQPRIRIDERGAVTLEKFGRRNVPSNLASCGL